MILQNQLIFVKDQRIEPQKKIENILLTIQLDLFRKLSFYMEASQNYKKKIR